MYRDACLSAPAVIMAILFIFFFQAEDGIRDLTVTGVQTCALPICVRSAPGAPTQLEGPRGVDDPAEGPPERRFEGALFGRIGIGDGGEDHTEIARVAPVVLDDHPLCLAHDARAGLTEVLHRRVRGRHHVDRWDVPAPRQGGGHWAEGV